MNAEQYPGPDLESQQRVEKRTRAQDQSLTAERQLKEVGLDFGMQFAVGENPVKAGTPFTQLWSMRVPAFTRLNETASVPPAHRNRRARTERTSSARKGPGD